MDSTAGTRRPVTMCSASNAPAKAAFRQRGPTAGPASLETVAPMFGGGSAETRLTTTRLIYRNLLAGRNNLELPG